MRTLKKLVAGLRDAWLMVGIAVLMVLSVELTLSIGFRVRDTLSGSSSDALDDRLTADTYASEDWIRPYFEEFERSNVVRWHPYVYWRRVPFNGAYITVNEEGIRRTLQVPSAPGQRTPLRIFMFGGSTLWGTGARDEFTIPSLLAKELQHQGIASQITNYGESGYVNTQEITALLLELRRGHVPDLVIFYDGINDTFSAFQQGVAGNPQNEQNRTKEFNLTRPENVGSRTAIFLGDLASRLRSAGILQRALAGGPEIGLSARPPASGAAPGTVIDTYLHNTELVQALSEHYHFRHIEFWQPTIFQKDRLTPYETHEREKMNHLAGFFTEVRAAASARLGENRSIHDISDAFAQAIEPMFVDWAHLGEKGNQIVCDRMLGPVLSVIRSIGSTPVSQ